jgi:hypothetical protein
MPCRRAPRRSPGPDLTRCGSFRHPRLTISGRPADDVAADLLVLPVAAGGDGPLAPPRTRAAHLDIAGPATLEEASYHQPKGASGCMVRTLLELLRAW